MKKWLVFILAMLCVFSVVACSGSKKPNTQETTQNTDDSDSAESLSPVPDDLDYNNIQINFGIREREDIAFEIDPEANSVDKMSSAISTRNELAENKLNVDIAIRNMPGLWAQQNEYMTAVRNSDRSGGDDMLDVLFGANYSLVPLMLEGYFVNLYDSQKLQYLDLNSSWWNANFIDECSYANKLYMVEGELTLTMLDSAFVVFCDTVNFKNLTEGDDLYGVVRDMEWTLEKMDEYVAGFGTQDLDADQRASNGDFFGMISPAFSCGRDGFPTAFGVKVVSKDESGKIVPTFSKEVNVNIYSDFYRFVNENEGVWVNGNNDGAREECRNMFTNGQTVFITELLNYASILRSQNRDYGIFPLPMYNTDQASYYTQSEAVHSQISVMKNSTKLEAISALLEEMGFQTHDSVLDEYYDMVKYRNNREPESVEMLNLILSSVTSSFGSQFSTEIGSPFPTPIGSQENITSNLEGQEDRITALMNTLKRKIQALE